MNFCMYLLLVGACVQVAISYVIVQRADGFLAHNQRPVTAATDNTGDILEEKTHSTSVFDRKLLELYYLVQIVRSYRRPAYQEPTVVLSNLIDRLTKEELREQLERMLVGVDGFEEIFSIGLHQSDSDERDPVKEQLANDFRLLFPIVVRTLTGLRDAHDGAVLGKPLTDNAVHSKIQEALNDFRNLLMSADQWEDSASVFEELNTQQKLTMDIVAPQVVKNTEETTSVLEETVFATEMPVASNQLVVNDYDLDENSPVSWPQREAASTDESVEFLPDGNELRYSVENSIEQLSHDGDYAEDDEPHKETEQDVIVLSQHQDIPNEKETSDPVVPLAVTVKDPQILAIIPAIVEQLRHDNVTTEEEEALAGIFADMWPLIKTEAYRLRHAE